MLISDGTGIENADELPYVTFLTGENHELYSAVRLRMVCPGDVIQLTIVCNTDLQISEFPSGFSAREHATSWTTIMQRDPGTCGVYNDRLIALRARTATLLTA